MREIILDTETTGLNPTDGHRIVEIGCIELINHVATENIFHQYINPERKVPEETFAIHGLSDEFLKDKPVFADIADRFLDFISDAPLVIHNAAFDMKFLQAELHWAGKTLLSPDRTIDTLLIARTKFPGAQNNLDALCKRFGIDNAHRTYHGALLDSELLAEVYLELIGGRQRTLVFDGAPGSEPELAAPLVPAPQARDARPAPLPPRLSDQEKTAHKEFIKTLAGKSLWGS